MEAPSINTTLLGIKMSKISDTHRLDTTRPPTDNTCTCSKPTLVAKAYMDSMKKTCSAN